MSDPERLSAPPTDSPAEPERSGPLIVERHRKDDGRLLILYRAAGESGTAAGESGTAARKSMTGVGESGTKGANG